MDCNCAPGYQRTRKNGVTLAIARVILTLFFLPMVLRFRRKMGYFPDAALPRTYTEKMQWRKMLDRNPLFIVLSDKIEARAYIEKIRVGIPFARLLWTGTDIRTVPSAVFSQPVILKANHGCGKNVVLTDESFDRRKVGRQTRWWLFRRRRNEEWAYGKIIPRLLIEELLPLGGNDLPTDIKVYVACGEVVNVWANDKAGGRSLTLDPDGKVLPGRDSNYPREDHALPYSPELKSLAQTAASIARRIAHETDFLRVDFLVSKGALFAGELTVYSGSGYERHANEATESDLAHFWDLRRSHFLKVPHRWPLNRYCEALIAEEEARLGRLQ